MVRVSVGASIAGMMRMLFVNPGFRSRLRPLDPHIDLSRIDPAAIHARDLQIRADVQRGHRIFKDLRRNPGIQQRANKHVAADTGEAFEISNAHQSFVGRSPHVVYGCQLSG